MEIYFEEVEESKGKKRKAIYLFTYFLGWRLVAVAAVRTVVGCFALHRATVFRCRNPEYSLPRQRRVRDGKCRKSHDSLLHATEKKRH